MSYRETDPVWDEPAGFYCDECNQQFDPGERVLSGETIPRGPEEVPEKLHFHIYCVGPERFR